jgi:response regulator of citrate/malate metabolism
MAEKKLALVVDDPAVKQRVANLGAFHYIVKPFNAAKLDEIFAKLK